MPNVDSTPLIRVGGVGDQDKYNQKLNEEYHQFEEVPLFTRKFGKTSPSKCVTKGGRERKHLKRPEMNIIPCLANPSANYGMMVKDVTWLDERLKEWVFLILYKTIISKYRVETFKTRI